MNPKWKKTLLALVLAAPLVAVGVREAWPSSNLSMADRSAINEARYNLATAALAWERYKPVIRDAQAAKAKFESAQSALHDLEQELSMKYTRGEKVLNGDLEWIDPPPPAPVDEPAATEPVAAAPIADPSDPPKKESP